MDIDENLTELFGAFIGDGWIESRTKNSLYILGSPIEDKNYYDYRISYLVKKVLKCKFKIRLFKYWHVYGLVIYNKAVISKLIELGFLYGKKVHKVSIPDNLLNKNKNLLPTIVRGIFDTDGSFYCKRSYGQYGSTFRKKFHCYPRLEIVSISLKLLKQVHGILTELGIKSTLRNGNVKGLYNKNSHQSYRLTIFSIHNIVLFFKIIKPKNQRHITRYRVWKKFGFLPPKTSLDERKKILKNVLNPYKYYAGVPERSNGLDFSTKHRRKANLKS